MSAEIVSSVIGAILIVTGVVGVVLPALPGAILVFAGVLVIAWGGDFTRIGAGTLIVLGVMTAATHLVDFVAAAAGVKRVGASGRAVAGAALGALAGVFLGLPGLILGPFVGALIGELSVRGDLRGAGRAGLAAWLGFVIGTVTKLALVFAMIGIALVALAL